MNQTLTIRIDEQTARQLDLASRATRKSKGELIREALRERFARRPSTALDALGKFVGVMEGPPDLSSNKKYLSGFGRRRTLR